MNVMLKILLMAIAVECSFKQIEYEIEEEIFKRSSFADIAQEIVSWLFIMPGTKWCGVGDNAENYEDLGERAIEDACCRTHDHCPNWIGQFEQKYGLLNTNFIYSKLHCDCDLQFYQCLQSANTTFAKLIGGIYYNTIGTQCFKLDYPIKTCKKYSTLPAIKCVEYDFDTSKSQKYQWFDVPNYHTSESAEKTRIGNKYFILL